jgi:hypothetical protein
LQIKVLCTTGINDTSGKFATGISDTSSKFAGGVYNIGGKFATGINDTVGEFYWYCCCRLIPVATNGNNIILLTP